MPGGNSTKSDSQAVQLYDAPCVMNWSKDFLAGKREQVLTSVERDLKSGSPHPLAAHVWTMTQFSLGQLEGAWEALDDDRLRRALGPLPNIYYLYERGEYKKALDEYPPSQAGEIRDFWSLLYLYYSANAQVRRPDGLTYLVAAARLCSDFFELAMCLVNLANYGYEGMRSDILSLIEPGGEFEGTLLGHFLTRVLYYRPFDHQEALAAVVLWLEKHPQDADALQAKGSLLLNSLERPESAVAAYAQSTAAYPFQFPWFNYAKALVQLGRDAEARQVVTQSAELFSGDVEKVPPLVEQRMAQAFRAAGEKGRARQVLEAAGKRWPDHAGLLRESAILELEGNRVAQALPFARKAAKLEPDSLADQVRLMEALQRSGSLQEAYDLFRAAEERLFQKSTDLYKRGGELLAAQGRIEEQVQLYERAVAEYPGSGWMHRELADALAAAGLKVEAIACLHTSFQVSSPSKWAIDKLRGLLTDTEGKDVADEELARLRDRFPWVQALWEDAASQLKGSDGRELQLELWRQAIAANPGRRWPWRKAFDLFLDDELWDEATQIAEEALMAVQQGGVRDRALAHFDRAIVTVVRLRSEYLDRQTLEEALEHLEAYCEGGGYPAAYHQYRAEVMKALGRNVEAAEDALAAANLRPDNERYVWNLFQAYSDEVGGGRAFAQAQRYLERDPFDGDRLIALIEMHTKWNGSPVTALQLMERLKEHAPDKASGRAFTETMAWSHLGDHRRHFRTSYGEVRGIHNSDRYVGWYEYARQKAQEESCTVDIDFESGLVTIYRPDGEVEKRQYHPVFGQPTLLQRGPVFLQGEYDEIDGRLTHIVVSSGAELFISYYPDGKIETVTTNDGEVRFEYDERRRPVRISMTGVGELVYVYDDAGQVQGVESPQGDGVKMTIQAFLVTCLQLLSAFEEYRYSTGLPDFPCEYDPQLDELRHLVQEKYQHLEESADDQRASLAAAKAQISLARYLITNLRKGLSYANEAQDILEGIFRYAEDPQAPSPVVDLGIEAVSLWHSLMLRSEMSNLHTNDYKQWSRMQRWLDEQVDRNPDNAPLRTLIREIGVRPLSLLESARWLPQSDLVNPAFWRCFPPENLLPPPLQSASINAILVRKNGEIVVGSAKGLCVLCGDSWVWFAFDEACSQFSASLPSDKVRASSDILVLAEDEQGTLWIGTADGLMWLSSSYEGEASRWYTAADGFSAPRIEHLAPYGSGMLVGTAEGLRFFSSDGEVSALAPPLDDPIMLLKAVPILPTEMIPDQGDWDEDWLQDLDTGEIMQVDDDIQESVVERPILVATKTALYGLVGGTVTRLLGGTVDGATWSPELRQVFILRDQQVYTLDWDGNNPPGRLIPLAGQQDIAFKDQVNGADLLPLDGRELDVVVLTDQGLSIFRDQHFENANVPPENGGVAVQAVSTWGPRTYMITSTGVHALEHDQAIRISDGRVHDLLVADDWGLAFVARDRWLQAVQLDDVDRGAAAFSRISATHLTRDGQGRLVTNGGTTIIRYPKASSDIEVLFNAEETLPQGWRTETTGKVTSLLTASDGSIWVTVGASVFQWRDGTVEEFSIFTDPERFPARSDMISRVIETFDGHIWVVASDERHRNYRGIWLSGGLLEWTGSAFRRLPLYDEEKHYWFITGYTSISEKMAIAGTTWGFAQHTDERYKAFEHLEDDSYKALVEKTPLTWLGTRGARLGDGTWLFGTAGGIVAYDTGRWYYPSHINWMLPDQHLREYGARTVHAVATDNAGRVFSGTDRGLLIYDWSLQAKRNLEG